MDSLSFAFIFMLVVVMKFSIRLLFVFILLAVCIVKANAQEYDSTYYEKYISKFCATICESNRNYKIRISSDPYSPIKDTIDVVYTGNTPFTTGICLDWDIFSLSVNFKSINVDENKKGFSDFFNIYFGFGNSKYMVELYYRYLKGFYDANSGYYQDTSTYYSQPNLVQEIYKAKFIYVFNDKQFAFKNGYTAIYQQKKSAATFLLQGNVFYNIQNNNDAFIPPPEAKNYAYSYKVNYLSNVGVALGGGGAGTWVIGKGFFVNGTLFMLAEFQQNTLDQTDGNKKTYFNVNAAFDNRICFGYNVRSFYTSVASRTETSIFRLYDIGLRSSTLFFDINIGYRFNLKDPKIMKKVRKTDVYKMFD